MGGGRKKRLRDNVRFRPSLWKDCCHFSWWNGFLTLQCMIEALMLSMNKISYYTPVHQNPHHKKVASTGPWLTWSCCAPRGIFPHVYRPMFRRRFFALRFPSNPFIAYTPSLTQH